MILVQIWRNIATISFKFVLISARCNAHFYRLPKNCREAVT